MKAMYTTYLEGFEDEERLKQKTGAGVATSQLPPYWMHRVLYSGRAMRWLTSCHWCRR